MTKANTKREEERTAATNAMAVLGRLTPASERTDRIIFVLRFPANVATSATFMRLEKERSLNEIRSQAARSLNAVCGLLDRKSLEQNTVEECKAALQAWLCALAEDAA